MSQLLEFLAQETGLSHSLVSRIVATAPQRYKVYIVPKRRGGDRIIAQPAREVKVLQRTLLAGPLSDLPVHSSATAYRSGSSIFENAKRHAGRSMILKIDFSDFFPSITSLDWKQYCYDNKLFSDEEDVDLTSLLLFRKSGKPSRLRLAIGAPASPTISNALMFDFDKTIAEIVAKDEVTYTRYADDLTFSALRTGYLKDVIKNVKRTLAQLNYPKLRINEKKTVLATTKYRRNVTGLILANDGRVTIGRYRKRLLSAMVYRAAANKLDSSEKQYLAGYLAFVSGIEPQFVSALTLRYGRDVMANIRKSAVIRRKIPSEIKDIMALQK